MNYPAFNIQLQAQYGDIVKWNLFRGNEVFLFNPAHIKAAFRQDGSKPLRSLMVPWVMMQQQMAISSSLLNSNGERWRSLRSAANPILASPRAVPSFLASQNAISDDFVRLLDERANAADSPTFTIPNFEHSLRLLAYECKFLAFTASLLHFVAHSCASICFRHQPDRLRHAPQLPGRANVSREHCPVRERHQRHAVPRGETCLQHARLQDLSDRGLAQVQGRRHRLLQVSFFLYFLPLRIEPIQLVFDNQGRRSRESTRWTGSSRQGR